MLPDRIDTGEFRRRLHAGLPVLSPNTRQILEACENPVIDLETLALTLGGAPAIAARLLGLANAPYYGMGEQVYSLRRAIQRLGLVTVRGISVGLIFSGIFDGSACRHFRADRFWMSAVLTAHLANQFARDVPADLAMPRDALYMTGLLHNIGLLALASLYPQQMENILSGCEGLPTPPMLSRELHSQLGIDHHEAGDWLGEEWQLPEALRAALRHHADRAYAGKYWPLVLLTGLSARLAHAMIWPEGTEGPSMESESAVLQRLGLDRGRIEPHLDAVRDLADMLQTSAEIFTRR